MPRPTNPNPCCILFSQVSVPRDALPPTPPGPEGSNGNGLLRVQWVAGAWLFFCLKIPVYPRNPKVGCEKFARLGNIVGRSLAGTPNQLAIVAAY